MIVRKRVRWLDGIDQIVLPLTARRLTTGHVPDPPGRWALCAPSAAWLGGRTV
jgi:hypothetical protein